MKPRNKGKRLYRCQECKEARFVHWTEAERSGGVKCNRCGSRRMELSEEGKDALAEIQASAAIATDRVEKNGTGSIIPG